MLQGECNDRLYLKNMGNQGSFQVVLFSIVFVLKIEFHFVAVKSVFGVTMSAIRYSILSRRFRRRSYPGSLVREKFRLLGSKKVPKLHQVASNFVLNFVGHWTEKSLKIKFNVHDVITCLNRNLSHFRTLYTKKSKWITSKST